MKTDSNIAHRTAGGARKPSILVADDEKVIRQVLERFLSEEGYDVSTAIDGSDALHKIEKNSYDLLLLDLKMPRMGGIELLGKIKPLERNLIVIVITGYATIDTAKEAIRKGCFDYITKPFDIDNVSIIVNRAFDVRRLEWEKKRLEEQYKVAEKLASLAQMGRGVVHEVNTVLTSTKLFLEMLDSKLPDRKEAENINLILEEIERSENMIGRFLAFAKPAGAELVMTDIREIIDRSLQFFKHRFEKQKIKVVKKLEKDIPQLFCDPLRVEEVFLNIYSNSVDAMPEGGILTVEGRADAENMVIEISNTGEEIPQEDIKNLYDPFFTTKPRGSGLGLSIVHRIIDEHKGIIKISSEKGKGTKVRIDLPISRRKKA